MAACNSSKRRNPEGPCPRRPAAALKGLVSSTVARYSSCARLLSTSDASPAEAETRRASAAARYSTCSVSMEKEDSLGGGGEETIFEAGPSSAGRQVRLSNILSCLDTQFVPFPLLRRAYSSLFSPRHLRRVSGVLLLSFVCLVAVSAALGSCLVSRAASSQQPLCAAPLRKKLRCATAQETPLGQLQNTAITGRLPLSRRAAASEMTAAAPQETRSARGRRMPAFLSAARISPHAFSDNSKQHDSPLASAERLAVSTAAFAAAPFRVSATETPSNAVASSASTAAAATPASASTAASPQRGRNSSTNSSSTATPEFDVVIVGLGVGGHAAALHATALGLRTAVVTGGDPGGTCVNRGCVPSKALLAIAKKVKTLRNKKLLAQMGIHLQNSRVEIDPAQVAQHAKDVVEKVRGGLVRSLAAHGVTSFEARGVLNGRADRVYLHRVSSSPSSSSSALPEYITTRSVVLAPGSTPFVPGGVELDEQEHRVMTSDACVTLPWLPSSVCIVGAGYIGLEFTDVFSSLGSEVTLVDSGPRVLPGVDAEIAKAAERLLLQQFKDRPVTLYRDSLASRVKSIRSSLTSDQQQRQETRRNGDDTCSQPPLVEVQLVNVKTKEKTKTLYTDACLIATGRIPNTQNLGLESLGVTLKRGGFVPVDPCMRVTRYSVDEAATGEQQKNGNEKTEVVDGLYCIGDANGQMMLAHAASAQGIAAVETIAGRPRVVNVKHIPAACFTSPEIAFVGDTEEAALKEGETKGFEVGKSVSHFKANTKAVAEGEAEGLLKVLYRKDNGKILGCHMIGMHASDLIQECATAIANDLTVRQLAFTTHTHPTLSEVVDAAWKRAVGMNAH